MERIELNGIWKLAVLSHQEFEKTEGTCTCALDLPHGTGIMVDARVPGNYEQDLMDAGQLEDLFYGKNLLKSREMEWNHLFYSRIFEAEPAKGETYRILFDGIDTVAEVFLNGVLLCKTDNMLKGYAVSIPEGLLQQGDNELFVHILPVVLKARSQDYPMALNGLKYEMDSLYIRKSPYMYGWDIFPRILSGGIWKDVFLEKIPRIEFLQSYLFVKKLKEDYSSCTLGYFCELELGETRYEDYELELEGICGSSRFFARTDLWSKAVHLDLTVENPLLWWPKRNGTPNLYQVTARLLRKGETCAHKSFRFGIRTVTLEKTSLTDQEGGGEFCFRINNRKLFVLGTNWVPLDSLPSRGRERISPALDMAEDLQCNMIRCWGGGYYEDDLFYDLCDEKGILVWQDFMEACGIYPQTDEFLGGFREEVRYQVRRLRQHACLALWAGDNENDMAYGWETDFQLNPNQNRNTREIIPEVLRCEDYLRPYLPSSPYMDETAYQSRTGDRYLPEQHLWGPRDYYKGSFYKDAAAHFASETGYHGCPSPQSISRFISPEALWPWQDNGEWFLHASSPTDKPEEPFAYRIKLMASQIQVLFGRIPDNLEEFSLLSQISQAEAKKYFIERFRIGKWKRTGIIWWNLLDGCPQFSDAVVDYYFTKKLAYGYIRRSQEKTALMMDEPCENRISLVGVNDQIAAAEVSFTVRDLYSGREALSGSSLIPGDSSCVLAVLDTCEDRCFYLIEWETGGVKYHNHYVTWQPPMDQEAYIRCARMAGILENNE